MTALAFTPDGLRLVTGGADRRATLLDVGTGQVRRGLLAPGRYVGALAVAVDGGAALVGTDGGSVLRWRLPEAATPVAPRPQAQVIRRADRERRRYCFFAGASRRTLFSPW